MSESALVLLQAAVILAAAVAIQAYAAGHVPQETVPQVLRPRIALCCRLRPWLLSLAAALAAAAILVR